MYVAMLLLVGWVAFKIMTYEPSPLITAIDVEDSEP